MRMVDPRAFGDQPEDDSVAEDHNEPMPVVIATEPGVSAVRLADLINQEIAMGNAISGVRVLGEPDYRPDMEHG